MITSAFLSVFRSGFWIFLLPESHDDVHLSKKGVVELVRAIKSDLNKALGLKDYSEYSHDDKPRNQPSKSQDQSDRRMSMAQKMDKLAKALGVTFQN